MLGAMLQDLAIECMKTVASLPPAMQFQAVGKLMLDERMFSLFAMQQLFVKHYTFEHANRMQETMPSLRDILYPLGSDKRARSETENKLNQSSQELRQESSQKLRQESSQTIIRPEPNIRERIVFRGYEFLLFVEGVVREDNTIHEEDGWSLLLYGKKSKWIADQMLELDFGVVEQYKEESNPFSLVFHTNFHLTDQNANTVLLMQEAVVGLSLLYTGKIQANLIPFFSCIVMNWLLQGRWTLESCLKAELGISNDDDNIIPFPKDVQAPFHYRPDDDYVDITFSDYVFRFPKHLPFAYALRKMEQFLEYWGLHNPSLHHKFIRMIAKQDGMKVQSFPLDLKKYQHCDQNSEDDESRYEMGILCLDLDFPLWDPLELTWFPLVKWAMCMNRSSGKAYPIEPGSHPTIASFLIDLPIQPQKVIGLFEVDEENWPFQLHKNTFDKSFHDLRIYLIRKCLKCANYGKKQLETSLSTTTLEIQLHYDLIEPKPNWSLVEKNMFQLLMESWILTNHDIAKKDLIQKIPLFASWNEIYLQNQDQNQKQTQNQSPNQTPNQTQNIQKEMQAAFEREKSNLGQWFPQLKPDCFSYLLFSFRPDVSFELWKWAVANMHAKEALCFDVPNLNSALLLIQMRHVLCKANGCPCIRSVQSKKGFHQELCALYGVEDIAPILSNEPAWNSKYILFLDPQPHFLNAQEAATTGRFTTLDPIHGQIKLIKDEALGGAIKTE
jgi:hypothetical protein